MSAPRTPLNNNGSLIIRFTHLGYRFTLSKLGAYADPIARKYAQTICDRIALDIASGNFTAIDNETLSAKYHSSSIPPIREIGLEALLKKRLEKKFSSADQSLLSLLDRYGKPIKTDQDAQRFMTWLAADRAATTVQRYLNTLKVISPLFSSVKIKLPTQSLPKPFTRHEVSQIQEWFTTHCPQYADFVACLFLTGMRTSEAIGLQWKDIDLEGRSLIISESLTSPTRDSKRIRKDTKTGVVRNFPLSGRLLEILQTRYTIPHKPDTLIFTSPKGTPINDHNFSQRQWKQCLKATHIPHRPFYNTRHTFISHYLAETKDVVSCAALTHGTRTGVQTLLKHYAGLIEQVKVPELY